MLSKNAHMICIYYNCFSYVKQLLYHCNILTATGAQPQASAVDVNGTHYFGGGGAAGGVSSTSSWESSRHHPHHQSSTDINQNINTTIPAYQKNRKSSQQDGLQHHATTLSNALSLPAEEYHHYREMTFESSREMEPNDPRHNAVPPTFCRAYCLDNDTDGTNSLTTQQRSSFGYPTSLFRVTSTTDGNLYCLRRLDSVRCVSHEIAQTVMHKWLMNDTGFDHPGIVKWYKCFLSNRAVFFVHHYYPGAVTLRERFFSNQPQQGGQGGNVPLPESLIWSCLVQLVSAIRAVHGSNLAVRTLQLNHILCTQETPSSATVSGAYGLPKLRLRINCVGIIDTLEFEARRSTEELKQSDMRALGCLLLSMCTGTEVTVNDIFDRRNISMQEQQQRGQMVLDYMNFVQQNYSREMYVLVHSLLNPNQPPNNIHGVATSMTMRAFDELDATHGCMDDMHNALMGIYESGRALKLLLKLAFVNERPEMGFDRNWSESGDCYVLKLFRDFGKC